MVHRSTRISFSPARRSSRFPRGMPCTLQYPTMRYFFAIASLPGRLSRAVKERAPLEDIEKADREDLLAFTPELSNPELLEEAEQRTFLLLCDVFVKPRFSLTPNTGKGEFHPSRLRPEDRLWVTEWVNGKMQSIQRGGSADLETFHPAAEPGQVAGSGGEAVG